MPRLTNLGALKCVDPTAWKTKIKEAMALKNGHVSDAAKLLDVSERQLFRWLAEPVLSDIKRAPTGVVRSAEKQQRTRAKAS